MLKVWDPLVRLLHWGLVAGVTAAWLSREGWPALHDAAGHLVLGLVAVRAVWGLVGPGNARFRGFVRAPRATLAYLRAVLAGREPRHIGHNPLGGWMIVALLLASLAAGFSGWLYTTDAYWGVERVERLHALSADLLLVLAGLHVAGVLFTSARQRENLVAAMIHGRKPRTTGHDTATPG